MPSRWRLRSRKAPKPPRPLVEDELESLSREVGGLSLLGEKPGVEGACERGTIDQLPILLDVKNPFADSSPPPSQPPSLTSESSRESFGPRTPPEPAEHPVTSSYKANRPPPSQPYTTGLQTGSSYQTNAPGPNFQNHVEDQRTTPFVSDVRPGQAHATSSSASSSPRSLQPVDSTKQQNKVSPPVTSSRKQTVAELLEEKLRLRREQQAPAPSAETRNREKLPPKITPERPLRPAMHIDLASLPTVNSEIPANNPELESPAVQYISEPSLPSSTHYQPKSRSSLGYEKKKPLSSTAAFPPPQDYFPRSTSPTEKSRQSSQSPPRRMNSTSGSPKRRTVTFIVDPQSLRSRQVQSIEYRRQDAPSSRPLRSESPQKQPSVQSSDVSNLALRPCPRSTPVAGYQDWYTMSGLTHLNICPSCMNQIGNSKFRDYFVPSLPNLRVPIRCSFSEPWTRLAWIQTLKKGYNNLDMLYEITRPTGLECPGRRLSAQHWYRVIDHHTGMNVPRFAACAACVRNLQLLMPPLQHSFSCQPMIQEKICDFAIDSPRFVQYLDLLDSAANHCEYKRLRVPNIDKFIDYVERKCSLRDCRRDKLVLGTWHYIPNLPEFTVCEDCYDDVVRPLAALNKPIAKMLANPPRLLPGSGPNRCREASCQLYSPRMRAQFRDAVLDDNFRSLESVVLRRFDAEQRYREKEDRLLLIEESDRGYPWQEEWHRNREEWKKYE